MEKSTEGYIKFNLNWEKTPFDFTDIDFLSLNSCRQKLFELGLIGAYPDGIGFGNLSLRYKKDEFIISGSETGNFKNLSKEHYALVEEFNIKQNSVHCIGLTKASSESMSHAAVYDSNPNVNAVIHVHHKKLWDNYLNIFPTTDFKAEFGTPEIAFEIFRLATSNNGIIIMGGHEEGIIGYGENLNETTNIIMNLYNTL